MIRPKAALVLTFCLPLVPVSRFFTLGGATPVPRRVKPSFTSVWSGTYQNYVEANFARHFGAFKALVKLDAIFDNWLGETRFNSGLCGLRGLNGTLFQHDEIDFINRRAFDIPAIQSKVRVLARAAAKLRSLGIRFKLIFIPTKESYFGADVPARWRTAVASPRPADGVTDLTLRELRRAGVDVLNGRDVITEVERLTAGRAFPREGRHFTEYTSCTLLARLDPQPRLCPVGASRPARGAELDLHRCFNEFGWWRSPERVVDTSVSTKHSHYRRALFVGTSFLRELENEARRLSSFEDLHLFYYNQTDAVGDREAPLPMGEAWRSFIRSRDLVVMDYFAPQVENLGYGFADRVDAEFERPDGG